MKTFPLSNGVPMHLLSELGLHETFLDTVERHRRDGLPLALNRSGRSELISADQLADKVRATRQRITELDAQISEYQRSYSLNETPPQS